MPDAIKRALDAATDRVMAEMGWNDDGSQDFEPIDTARHVAAGAVVAFLNALHESADGAHVEYGTDRTVWAGEFDGVATAVTRAAEGAEE